MMTTIEHRSETCREVLRVYSLKSGAMRPMLGRSAGTWIESQICIQLTNARHHIPLNGVSETLLRVDSGFRVTPGPAHKSHVRQYMTSRQTSSSFVHISQANFSHANYDKLLALFLKPIHLATKRREQQHSSPLYHLLLMWGVST